MSKYPYEMSKLFFDTQIDTIYSHLEFLYEKTEELEEIINTYILEKEEDDKTVDKKFSLGD